MKRKGIQAIGLVIGAAIGLIAAQMLAALLGSLMLLTGMPLTFGNIIVGLLYGFFIWIGIWGISRARKTPWRDFYLSAKFSLFWGIIAVVLPLTVVGIYLQMPGHFVDGMVTMENKTSIITAAIFFYGIGTGCAEEMLFRGVLLKKFSDYFGKRTAILLTSVCFAFLHLFNGALNLASALQMLIAITLIGILFALITIETGSVLNSILIHAVWNSVIIGNIVTISTEPSEMSLWTYVLDSQNTLLTGGQWGIEASVIVMALSILLIIVAVRRYRQNEKLCVPVHFGR